MPPAVAWAAREARCAAVVVMPDDAPRSKIDAVRGYGAEIVFHGDRPTLFDRLHQVRDERGLTFVHPFDDPVVLAGAGTAGLEIVEDLPDLGLVVIPVGGGGLLSGVASAIRALCPRARVVAVELEAGPGLGPALAAGKPVPAPRPPTIADGMTPPFVGALAVEIAREAVDEIVTVTEEEILEGMRMLATRAKLFVEGSGAAATGALLARKIRAPHSTIAAVHRLGRQRGSREIRDDRPRELSFPAGIWFERDPEATAVAAANLAFYRALEARDLAVHVHGLAPGCDSSSCVHPGWHRLDGWEEIERSWENIFANSRPWSVSCEDVRIAVAGDLAWVTCVEVIVPFGGDEGSDAARMQATNLFGRVDGEWRLLHHHASPSPTGRCHSRGAGQIESSEDGVRSRGSRS